MNAHRIYEGIALRCPTCGARPGSPCISGSGLFTSLPHRTRLNAAVAAQEQDQ